MHLTAEQSSKLHNDVASEALKKELLSFIAKIISEKGWSGRAAANALEVDQAKVSYIINGHTHKFSIDYLVDLLDKLKYNIHSKTSKKFTLSIAPVPERRISPSF